MRETDRGKIELNQGETKRFSPEAREALEKLGYRISPLTGQSIKTLREAGKILKLTSIWRKDFPDFEALTSRLSEVAINSSQLFLPDSNNKTLAEQEKMVEEFSQKLSKKIEGVEAIIGEAPDYVELTFAHLEATGEYLFGKKYNYGCARTKTPTSRYRVAFVGSFDGSSLSVFQWFRRCRIPSAWAVPLVVPK